MRLSAATKTKAVSLLTALCFIFTGVFGQFAYAVTSADADEIRSFVKDSGSFVPYSAGKVSYAGYFGSDEVVINIQDLHCHGEAQEKIAHILKELDKKYGFEAVYLEGAVENVSTEMLTELQNSALGAVLLENLMSQGKLMGAEYYSAISGRPGLIKALEKENIYFENLGLLGSIYDMQEETGYYIDGLKENVEKLKKEYYGPDLIRLDKAKRDFSRGRVSAKKYYLTVKKSAKKAGININAYGNVENYIQLINSKGISYGKVTEELSLFINILKNMLPYGVYQELEQKSDNFSRINDLMPLFAALSQHYGICDKSRLNNLKTFFSYIERDKKMNALSFVSEEEKLLMDIDISLSQNSYERDIIFMDRFTSVLEGFYTAKITAEDYAYYISNAGRFKTLAGIYLGPDDANLAFFNANESLFEKYHSNNIRRDEIFAGELIKDTAKTSLRGRPSNDFANLRHIEESLDNNAKLKIVITGGFHSDGLRKKLIENGISFVVITPNIAGGLEEADNAYHARVKEYSGIFKSAINVMPVTGEPVQVALPKMTAAAIEEALSRGMPFDELEEIINEVFSKESSRKKISGTRSNAKTVTGAVVKDVSENSFEISYLYGDGSYESVKYEIGSGAVTEVKDLQITGSAKQKSSKGFWDSLFGRKENAQTPEHFDYAKTKFLEENKDILRKAGKIKFQKNEDGSWKAFFGRESITLPAGISKEETYIRLRGLIREFLKADTEGNNHYSTFFYRKTRIDTIFNPIFDLSSKEGYLPEMLRNKIDKGNRSLRVWSCGASTGEELRTLAWITRQALAALGEDPAEWKLDFFGTDNNKHVLKIASMFKGKDIRSDNGEEVEADTESFNIEYFPLSHTGKEELENWIVWNSGENAFDIVFQLNTPTPRYVTDAVMDSLPEDGIYVYHDKIHLKKNYTAGEVDLPEEKMPTASLLEDIFKNKNSAWYKIYTMAIAPVWEESVFRFATFVFAAAILALNPAGAVITVAVSIILFSAAHMVVRWLIAKNPPDLRIFIPASIFTASYLLMVIFFPGTFIASNLAALCISILAHSVYNFLVYKGWLRLPIAVIGGEISGEQEIEPIERFIIEEDADAVIKAVYSKIEGYPEGFIRGLSNDEALLLSEYLPFLAEMLGVKGAGTEKPLGFGFVSFAKDKRADFEKIGGLEKLKDLSAVPFASAENKEKGISVYRAGTYKGYGLFAVFDKDQNGNVTGVHFAGQDPLSENFIVNVFKKAAEDGLFPFYASADNKEMFIVISDSYDFPAIIRFSVNEETEKIDISAVLPERTEVLENAHLIPLAKRQKFFSEISAADAGTADLSGFAESALDIKITETAETGKEEISKAISGGLSLLTEIENGTRQYSKRHIFSRDLETLSQRSRGVYDRAVKNFTGIYDDFDTYADAYRVNIYENLKMIEEFEERSGISVNDFLLYLAVNAGSADIKKTYANFERLYLSTLYMKPSVLFGILASDSFNAEDADIKVPVLFEKFSGNKYSYLNSKIMLLGAKVFSLLSGSSSDFFNYIKLIDEEMVNYFFRNYLRLTASGAYENPVAAVYDDSVADIFETLLTGAKNIKRTVVNGDVLEGEYNFHNINSPRNVKRSFGLFVEHLSANKKALEFFEVYLNQELGLSYRTVSDDDFNIYADEIALVLSGFLQKAKARYDATFISPMEKAAQALYIREGSGIEFKLMSRDADDIMLGRLAGDCTKPGKERFGQYMTQWYPNSDFNTLSVFADGKFVLKFNLMRTLSSAGENGRKILIVDAVEASPVIREGELKRTTEAGKEEMLDPVLLAKREEALALAYKYIRDFAAERDLGGVYVCPSSLSDWVMRSRKNFCDEDETIKNFVNYKNTQSSDVLGLGWPAKLDSEKVDTAAFPYVEKNFELRHPSMKYRFFNALDRNRIGVSPLLRDFGIGQGEPFYILSAGKKVFFFKTEKEAKTYSGVLKMSGEALVRNSRMDIIEMNAGKAGIWNPLYYAEQFGWKAGNGIYVKEYMDEDNYDGLIVEFVNMPEEEFLAMEIERDIEKYGAQTPVPDYDLLNRSYVFSPVREKGGGYLGVMNEDIRRAVNVGKGRPVYFAFEEATGKTRFFADPREVKKYVDELKSNDYSRFFDENYDEYKFYKNIRRREVSVNNTINLRDMEQSGDIKKAKVMVLMAEGEKIYVHFVSAAKTGFIGKYTDFFPESGGPVINETDGTFLLEGGLVDESLDLTPPVAFSGTAEDASTVKARLEKLKNSNMPKKNSRAYNKVFKKLEAFIEKNAEKIRLLKIEKAAGGGTHGDITGEIGGFSYIAYSDKAHIAALREDLFDNDIALFHELMHLAVLSGEISYREILEAVHDPEIRKEFFEDKTVEKDKTGDFDGFIAVVEAAAKNHYAIRAFQRSYFADDALLTGDIRAASSLYKEEKEEALEAGQDENIGFFRRITGMLLSKSNDLELTLTAEEAGAVSAAAEEYYEELPALQEKSYEGFSWALPVDPKKRMTIPADMLAFMEIGPGSDVYFYSFFNRLFISKNPDIIEFFRELLKKHMPGIQERNLHFLLYHYFDGETIESQNRVSISKALKKIKNIDFDNVDGVYAEGSRNGWFELKIMPRKEARALNAKGKESGIYKKRLRNIEDIILSSHDFETFDLQYLKIGKEITERKTERDLFIYPLLEMLESLLASAPADHTPAGAKLNGTQKAYVLLLLTIISDTQHYGFEYLRGQMSEAGNFDVAALTKWLKDFEPDLASKKLLEEYFAYMENRIALTAPAESSIETLASVMAFAGSVSIPAALSGNQRWLLGADLENNGGERMLYGKYYADIYTEESSVDIEKLKELKDFGIKPVAAAYKDDYDGAGSFLCNINVGVGRKFVTGKAFIEIREGVPVIIISPYTAITENNRKEFIAAGAAEVLKRLSFDYTVKGRFACAAGDMFLFQRFISFMTNEGFYRRVGRIFEFDAKLVSFDAKELPGFAEKLEESFPGILDISKKEADSRQMSGKKIYYDTDFSMQEKKNALLNILKRLSLKNKESKTAAGVLIAEKIDSRLFNMMPQEVSPVDAFGISAFSSYFSKRMNYAQSQIILLENLFREGSSVEGEVSLIDWKNEGFIKEMIRKGIITEEDADVFDVDPNALKMKTDALINKIMPHLDAHIKAEFEKFADTAPDMERLTSNGRFAQYVFAKQIKENTAKIEKESGKVFVGINVFESNFVTAYSFNDLTAAVKYLATLGFHGVRLNFEEDSLFLREEAFFSRLDKSLRAENAGFGIMVSVRNAQSAEMSGKIAAKAAPLDIITAVDVTLLTENMSEYKRNIWADIDALNSRYADNEEKYFEDIRKAVEFGVGYLGVAAGTSVFDSDGKSKHIEVINKIKDLMTGKKPLSSEEAYKQAYKIGYSSAKEVTLSDETLKAVLSELVSLQNGKPLRQGGQIEPERAAVFMEFLKGEEVLINTDYIRLRAGLEDKNDIYKIAGFLRGVAEAGILAKNTGKNKKIDGIDEEVFKALTVIDFAMPPAGRKVNEDALIKALGEKLGIGEEVRQSEILNILAQRMYERGDMTFADIAGGMFMLQNGGVPVSEITKFMAGMLKSYLSVSNIGYGMPAVVAFDPSSMPESEKLALESILEVLRVTQLKPDMKGNAGDVMKSSINTLGVSMMLRAA